ncbi:hypothetical protein BC941DRAFT_475486 [Chlamydoabsidia padenii]|nr:hypothetical protein BC941DRAFT_475486 [Chlamydoabsidia padenii]
MDTNYRSIPFELLELIITHVGDKKDLLQCTLVNKLFYVVANPKLWHSPIHYVGSSKYTVKPVLNSLQLADSCSHLHPVPLGSYIRKLSFCYTYYHQSGNLLGESPWDLISLLERTSKVEELILEGNALTDEHMNRIAYLCPQLTTLTLINTYSITSDALKLFGRTLSSLSLSIFSHSQLTMAPIQGCLLKKLTLTGFGSNKYPLRGIPLQHFVEALSQLEELELRDFISLPAGYIVPGWYQQDSTRYRFFVMFWWPNGIMVLRS